MAAEEAHRMGSGSAPEGEARFSPGVIPTSPAVAEAARSMGAEACLAQGQALWEGTSDLPVNRGEAALWFEQAALKGSPEAMFAFAESLRWGDGVMRNPERAEVLYRLAAEAGFEPAIHWLAHAYQVGDGVTRNAEEAARWRRRGGSHPLGPWGWVLLGVAVGAWLASLAWVWRYFR